MSFVGSSQLAFIDTASDPSICVAILSWVAGAAPASLSLPPPDASAPVAHYPPRPTIFGGRPLHPKFAMYSRSAAHL